MGTAPKALQIAPDPLGADPLEAAKLRAQIRAELKQMTLTAALGAESSQPDIGSVDCGREYQGSKAEWAAAAHRQGGEECIGVDLRVINIS